MSEVTHTPENVTLIREWTDTEGHELNRWGDYDWPYPTEYREYIVGGQLRTDVLARLGYAEGADVTLRLIESDVSGGWSEFTQETDCGIEFWVDHGSQSQRVWSNDYVWGDRLAAFIKWLEQQPTRDGLS